jgi:hypothetical protein
MRLQADLRASRALVVNALRAVPASVVEYTYDTHKTVFARTTARKESFPTGK